MFTINLKCRLAGFWGFGPEVLAQVGLGLLEMPTG